jgi:hypothetical protein
MRLPRVLSLLVAVACGGRAEQGAPAADGGVDPVDVLHTTITLERTACFGTCPIYAPTVLDTLEQRIDEVAGAAEWVNCATPDGVCQE